MQLVVEQDQKRGEKKGCKEGRERLERTVTLNRELS